MCVISLVGWWCANSPSRPRLTRRSTFVIRKDASALAQLPSEETPLGEPRYGIEYNRGLSANIIPTFIPSSPHLLSATSAVLRSPAFTLSLSLYPIYPTSFFVVTCLQLGVACCLVNITSVTCVILSADHISFVSECWGHRGVGHTRTLAISLFF